MPNDGRCVTAWNNIASSCIFGVLHDIRAAAESYTKRMYFVKNNNQLIETIFVSLLFQLQDFEKCFLPLWNPMMNF